MMEPWCTGRNLTVALFVVTNVIVISVLMLDFSPILTKYQLYTQVNPDDDKQESVGWAPFSGGKEGEGVKRDDSTAWTRHALEWWENEKLSVTDANWRGRHHMHETLKNGNLWFDEKFEKHFIATLEERQFPADCSKNHWIAYQPMESGLLSCVHVITAVLMMGLVKGDQHTLIPIGYLTDPSLPTSPTYDGCGERKDRHLGCFFNFTSCRVEDDQVRHDAVISRSNSTDSLGDTWDAFMSNNTAPGGMTVLRNWVWPPVIVDNARIEAGSKKPKVLFWNEVRKHGSVGVYGMPEEALEHIWEDQMEFLLTSIVSSWMLRQTSRRVKDISDEIMAKYSDARGRPLWTAPVLTIHIRQTDKSWEDPYFQKYQKYRNVSDYINEMNKFESMYGFKWQSLFLISDSGSALQSLAETVNDMSGLPDSANGEEGKRFIMYDWTDDKDLIERTGGHNLIPEDKKHTAQEHFLATLYVIEKISDFAIVQYSSNVGRFISELIGSRHRVSCADRIGPNALSMDYYWRHD